MSVDLCGLTREDMPDHLANADVTSERIYVFGVLIYKSRLLFQLYFFHRGHVNRFRVI